MLFNNLYNMTLCHSK